ncbi:alpha/beta hydrolase [uncultured Succinivibrio sp.]|uniref:alpha/beta hydrolase n=1 Tax=uncultured Succinivibrio sp. TaxID=540749 RepID=UPI0025DE98F6|nr:alpha/beta hydrolase [uncultured Succinivibrio sp.]
MSCNLLVRYGIFLNICTKELKLKIQEYSDRFPVMTYSVKKRVVFAIIVVAAIILIAGYAIGCYFINYALKRGNETDPLAPPSACVSILDRNVIVPSMPEAPAEKWTITAPENRKLFATFYVPATEKHLWVILAHGYGRNQRYVGDFAKAYLQRNWNVLTPDLCASGESEGQYITMGIKESVEIVLWAKKIIERDPKAQIVLHGISMGAASVLMAAANNNVPGLKSVIEDCSYTSAYEMFARQLEVLFGLPEFPVMSCIDLVSGIKIGARISDASPLKVMSRINVPVMFIHGDKDTLVPLYMMEQLYDSCRGPKTKLVVKGAGHGDSLKEAGDEYWKAVFSFISSA